MIPPPSPGSLGPRKGRSPDGKSLPHRRPRPNSPRRPAKSRSSVPALDRAFQILDMLAMSSVGLTKMEIAIKLRLPYSSVFNILSTMEVHSYVRKESTGKYHLGLKLLSLGTVPFRDVGIREAVSPALEEAVHATGLTGHLAILDRGEAVYIDKKEGGGYIKLNSWIGKRNYAHSSAVGKVLIAYQPKSAVSFEKANLPKRTPKTITNPRKLHAELLRIRKQGFAIDDEEDEPGGRCVAAPVMDSSGKVVAAVGISGITLYIPDQRLPKLAEVIRECALKASAMLGYRSRTALEPLRGRVRSTSK